MTQSDFLHGVNIAIYVILATMVWFAIITVPFFWLARLSLRSPAWREHWWLVFVAALAPAITLFVATYVPGGPIESRIVLPLVVPLAAALLGCVVEGLRLKAELVSKEEAPS